MANSGDKGYVLEELLRAYFLRAGMYAVRGVPLQLNGDDLTDIDIWLYERSTGSSRRRQIVDAKSKLKPKAIERLLWTKGLLDLLQVDGAQVATTDSRVTIKHVAARLGISVLDGSDLKRMSASEKILFSDRLSEEDFDKSIKIVDKGRRNKDFQIGYQDLKAGLIDGFGAGTVNRSLDHFVSFTRALVSSHPSSIAAEVALRLAYVAASIVALTLDFCLAKVSFKSIEDRRRTILNVIRYGDEDELVGLEKVRVAAALIERYAPNGRAISQSMMNSVQSDLQSIPAEVITDHILSQLRGDSLFRIAKSLEFEGFRVKLRSYDRLTIEERSFLGVLMDFAALERSAFANSWPDNSAELIEASAHARKDDAGLFFDN
ncbi:MULTISPECIES: hypothetical protein [Pseudomonas]|uniref:Restriction endonuclease type IV Mrr domain-containing protein n=2 Tax=Pseudomonas fragariae (ex Marin et al. 2024) TaxID=3080056 RepID=A0ABT3LR72_9PSED|nr:MULTISPECIES: hypothetical protein [Pseudomonas]MCW6058648.1 hypothetical protein [Pseudomonas fragi]MDV0428747.1 hypothetical protein [Pseudomonas sp. 17]MDX9572430.1 hypothetical protein [Pseudomonas sp. 21(2023)]MDX9588703.1 hypothetical protein [Pseudomonas sp. 19(2023)]MDX9626082.1 hypothetical protein [Pseudomonas sp. 20]